MHILNPNFKFLNQSFTKPDHHSILSFNALLGKDAKTIAFFVNLVFLSALIAQFGIAANIVNLINFAKQGFDNSVNISLFGIAVSDLCALVTILWLGVCVNPLLQSGDISFEELEYLTAGWPHCIFSRITCMITVYITIERCLCVTVPLKVKNIITKTTTIATVITIFVSQMLTVIPSYYSTYYGWKFDQEKNRSVLGLCKIDNWTQVEILTFLLQTIMLGGSFILLVVFTIVLVVNIRKKTQWRQCATSMGQQETISNRDRKLVKMIILISVILIACFTPSIMCCVSMSIEPDFNMGERYDNVFWVVWSLAFLSQTTNSSVNIFVYYRMSTKYRLVFNEIFTVCKRRMGLDGEGNLVDTDDC